MEKKTVTEYGVYVGGYCRPPKAKTDDPAIIKGIDTEKYGLIQESDGTFSVKEYNTLKVDFNKENNKPIHQQVNEMNGHLRKERMEEAERKANLEQDHFSLHDAQLAANYEHNTKETVMDKMEFGNAIGQTCNVAIQKEEKTKWHPTEPTTILSKAIEQVEQLGDYKVMIALVDLDKTKPKEERLYTFTDIESKKLRKVIYKEMEKEA